MVQTIEVVGSLADLALAPTVRASVVVRVKFSPGGGLMFDGDAAPGVTVPDPDYVPTAYGGARTLVSDASWRQATGNLLRGLAWTADGVLIGVCQSGYTCLLLNVDVT